MVPLVAGARQWQAPLFSIGLEANLRSTDGFGKTRRIRLIFCPRPASGRVVQFDQKDRELAIAGQKRGGVFVKQRLFVWTSYSHAKDREVIAKRLAARLEYAQLFPDGFIGQDRFSLSVFPALDGVDRVSVYLDRKDGE
jgi:hypothetical protein